MLEQLKTDRIAQLILAAIIGLSCVAFALIATDAYTTLAPLLVRPTSQIAQQPSAGETLPSPTIIPSPEATATPTLTPVAYDLDWKIAEDQPIAYQTMMEVLSSTVSMDFGPAFGGTLPDQKNPFNKMVEEMNQSQQTFSLISVLEKNERGNISIKIFLDKVSASEPNPDNLMQQQFSQLLTGLQGSLQLQGEVSPDGAITSFYTAQQQKNLLALFFQLPAGPVKVGDTWPLDLTCIAVNAAQFTIENSNSLNQVKLTDITQNSTGQPVAVLDYSIEESVEGKQILPFSSNDPIPSSMHCSFVGQGRFLIDQGRWQDFSVLYSVRTTGVITSDVTQRLALSPLEKVPEPYLNPPLVPILIGTPESPLTDTPSIPPETPTPQAQNSVEPPTPGNETVAGEEAVDLGLCRFVSEAVVEPDKSVTLWSGSYSYAGPSDGPPLAVESIAILDLLGVEGPDTLELHGKTYTRTSEGEVLRSTLEPDPNRPPLPAVNLTLMSVEKDIEAPITLTLAGQVYPLKLDYALDEFARNLAKEDQHCTYLPPEAAKIAIEAMKNR